MTQTPVRIKTLVRIVESLRRQFTPPKGAKSGRRRSRQGASRARATLPRNNVNPAPACEISHISPNTAGLDSRARRVGGIFSLTGLVFRKTSSTSHQMGKKRPHAETRDGFKKPPPDKGSIGVNGLPVAKKDHKEKKKNGESGKKKANLV